MSELLTYLNEFHKTPEKLVQMMLDIDVNVKIEDDLYLFKYRNLGIKWGSLTRECRGAIFRHDPIACKWTPVSRPFDKFFNLGEENCEVQDEDFPLSDEYTLREKFDGTLIQLWWCTKERIWRTSTLGAITTGPVRCLDPGAKRGDEMSFEDLFWRTSLQTRSEFTKEADKKYTYLLELCCEENQILNLYECNKAVFIGARHLYTGAYQRSWNGIEVSSFSKEKIIRFVEFASLRTETYGTIPEGFVLYKGGRPVAKIKNSKYLSLHRVSGADIPCARNSIIDAIFTGKFDDIEPALNNRLKEFAKGVIAKRNRMEVATKMNRLQMLNKFETRKDAAIFINSKVPKETRSFHFLEVLSYIKGGGLGKESFEDSFDAWLSKSYGKLDWQ